MASACDLAPPFRPYRLSPPLPPFSSPPQRTWSAPLLPMYNASPNVPIPRLLHGSLTTQLHPLPGRGHSPGNFGPEHLERLETDRSASSASPPPTASRSAGPPATTSSTRDFDLAKNVVNDTLHFALRIDQQDPGRPAARPTPRSSWRRWPPSQPQRPAQRPPEARGPSARPRHAGRRGPRRPLPAPQGLPRPVGRPVATSCWSAPRRLRRSTGCTRCSSRRSATASSRSAPAGRRFRLAEVAQQTRGVDDAAPPPSCPAMSRGVAWLPDEASRDFLGNEFLLWLWYSQDETRTRSRWPTIRGDGDAGATLTLECPRGQTGKESITQRRADRACPRPAAPSRPASCRARSA